MSTAQSATASIDAHTLTEAQPGQGAEASEQPKLEKSESKKSIPDEYADKEKQEGEEEDESRFVTGRKLVLIFMCGATV